MRLELLKIYLCILETGSIAGASRRLHITQPAVSMALASLETELDQRLLIRTKGQRRAIELTTAGNIFADYARRALAEYKAIRIEIASEHPHYEPFTLVTTPAPGAVITPILVRGFKKTFPDVPFSVITSTGTDIFRKLRNKEAQVAITGTCPSDEDLAFESFFHDPLELICPVSLNIQSPITLNKLKKLPFITRPDTSNVMQLVLKALKKVHIDLSEMNVVMQVYGNSDVLQAVTTGSGVGFVTRSILASSRSGNIQSILVKRFHVIRHIHIVRKKNTPFRDGIRLFWNFALETQWREKDFPYDTLM